LTDLSFRDTRSYEKLERDSPTCPSLSCARTAIFAAEILIHGQLETVSACEKKPVAIYGGPATGKSSVMRLLFDRLKSIKDFRPMLISLWGLSPRAAVGHNEAFTCSARKGLSSSDLMARIIAKELLGDGADMETVTDWRLVDRHIDSCIGESGKFILLLDDLPYLECPLKPATEAFLRSFYMKSNRCLVFSSSVPMFNGMGALPCIPTSRAVYCANEHVERDVMLDFKGACRSDWYLCGGVPGLIHSRLRAPGVVAEKINSAWSEMSALAPFRMVSWPTLQQFVGEVFMPTPFPPTIQYFTHMCACLMSWGPHSYIYWPPLVIAEIMSVYEKDSRCCYQLKKAAELINWTINRIPYCKFLGVVREWEYTVRVSMLLWTIRIFESVTLCDDFLRSFFDVTVLDNLVTVNRHRAIRVLELSRLQLRAGKPCLDKLMHSARNGSITVFLPSHHSDASGGIGLAGYCGMIGVKDCQGKVEYFGFLGDEKRAGQQPKWIVRSALILPQSPKPSADRLAELENMDWMIWSEYTVARFLGFSVAQILGFPLSRYPGIQEDAARLQCDDRIGLII
jgi:hypothetical protein